MQYLLEMIRQGWDMIPYDPYLEFEIQRTLRLAFYSTGIAILIGTVPAYLIGVRTARLSRWGLIVTNAALGLPAVGVGIVLYITLPGNTPWGPGWIGLNAMILGQTVLATPIVIALTAAAIRGLPDGLIDQARAFGGYGWRLGVFAFREARVGIVSAVIVCLGAAIGEVGAVVILGTNTEASTSTISSDILNDLGPHGGAGWGSASPSTGVAPAVEHTIIVLAMLLPLGVILTIVQQWGKSAQRQQHGVPSSDKATPA